VLRRTTVIANMGVWRGVFGWNALFSWTVLGVIVPGILIGCGFALLAIDWFPHNLLIAQICVSISAVLLIVKIIGHAIVSEGSKGQRAAFAVVLCCVAIAIAMSIDWIVQKHKTPLASHPISTSRLHSQPSPNPPVSPAEAKAHVIHKPKHHHPIPPITGPIIQTNNAPCTGNSLTGNVNINCNPPVTTTYTKEGFKRIHTSDELGEKFSIDQSLEIVFGQLETLSVQRNWKGVLELTEKTRKTDPGWSTLNWFSGWAHIKLCQKKQGERDLHQFLSDTATREDYARMRRGANDLLTIVNNDPAYCAAQSAR
jgi:hypothetical protein